MAAKITYVKRKLKEAPSLMGVGLPCFGANSWERLCKLSGCLVNQGGVYSVGACVFFGIGILCHVELPQKDEMFYVGLTFVYSKG